MRENNLDQTGQHYMVDKNLIRFIVDNAELKKTDIVLEIGYGKGALTKELSKKCRVVAIDPVNEDLRLKNVIQVQGNILERFEELYAKHRFNKIVANIPYNISEPLMRKLFKSNVESCVLTVGKNFSDILTKKDNRIGVLANSIYSISIIRTVPPESFFPMPRVDSTVISMKSRESNTIYRRILDFDEKKLKNAIENIPGRSKREWNDAMAGSGLDIFNKRIYELSNVEFMKLDEFLKIQNMV